MIGTINIPERLVVGFNKRPDTYTKTLAFITYMKGKNIAKQTSWDGWRDKTIEPQEYDNVPTDGFVLNKNGGGGRGWDARNAFIRVYDPRGFEFEITISNLLYILEHATCYPGKGLEGSFVYAWEGAQLLLVPTVSEMYRKSVAYKKRIAAGEKFTKKTMVVGCAYEFKDGSTRVYVGIFPVRGWSSSDPMKEEFVFYTGNCFISYKTLNGIVGRVTYEQIEEFDQIMEALPHWYKMCIHTDEEDLVPLSKEEFLNSGRDVVYVVGRDGKAYKITINNGQVMMVATSRSERSRRKYEFWNTITIPELSGKYTLSEIYDILQPSRIVELGIYNDAKIELWERTNFGYFNKLFPEIHIGG